MDIGIGVFSGILMIFGGISVFLQGIGRLPVNKNPERQATWRSDMGPLYKYGGPIMIIAGFLKVIISF
ncbi:MAG: hypothetical protein JNL11_17120 [Bdellovibrionaceae bacterium]|nr:hypothetical protein [Pseudobdellovibrionaceae bacterium]